jgi:hypothetical protein
MTFLAPTEADYKLFIGLFTLFGIFYSVYDKFKDKFRH